MNIAKHDLTIAVPDKDPKYEVGDIYLIAISDDLLLVQCVEVENGHTFGFDVLNTTPRPLMRDGSGNYAV